MQPLPNLLQLLSIMAIPLLFAITLHEAAHGWVANRLGDPTAKLLGRLSVNPIKHIDLIGTVLVPVLMASLTNFIFGWAKPVPVNWHNLKQPRRDMALVAIAGPASNLLMALGWAMIAKLMIILMGTPITASTSLSISHYLFLSAYYGVFINIILMVLNLIPLPPLDGSRVLSALLPPQAASAMDQVEPYGIWILLALLLSGVLKPVIFVPVTHIVDFIRVLFGIYLPS